MLNVRVTFRPAQRTPANAASCQFHRCRVVKYLEAARHFFLLNYLSARHFFLLNYLNLFHTNSLKNIRRRAARQK